MSSRHHYIVGFFLSLMITFTAFFLVWRFIDSNRTGYSTAFMLSALTILAITQLIVQLNFFLHLSSRSRPNWNVTSMAFALLIVLIIVFGSLWIMQNLKYKHGGHDMPSTTDAEILQDENIYR